MLDYSYENEHILNEKEHSEYGREYTQKSEISEKNDIFSHQGLFEKIHNKEILYTNEISFDIADEKFKNLLFKKN
jgi:hypothetical protein